MKRNIFTAFLVLMTLLAGACGNKENTLSYDLVTVEETNITESNDDFSDDLRLQPEIKVSSDNMYWVQYNLSESSFKSPEEIEELSIKYLNEIGSLLNMEDWWNRINPNTENITMVFEFSNADRSETRIGFQKEGETSLYCTINLTVKAIEMGLRSDGAMAHELTHAIGFDRTRFSISLCEGICEYSQKNVGDWEYSEAASSQDVTVLLYQALEQYIDAGTISQEYLDDIISEVGSQNSDYTFEGSQFNHWYIFSTGFVDYLINEYGIEKVTNLALNGDSESSYREILGNEFKDIKQNWVNSIETYEPTVTIENIMK